jgi:meiosis-specific transcription factor NDT80
MASDQQNCNDRGGPPFHETTVRHNVMTVRGERLVPEITASIQKGFFQVDRNWTCYRRNYFSVQCAFNFRNNTRDQPFYLRRNGGDQLIHQFAVSISAKTQKNSNGESESRGLVQHTPKRDKATESVPCRQPVAPMLGHSSSGYSTAGHTYAGGNHLHSAMNMPGFPGYETPGSSATPTSHTFERIQFQKATANNGKRRAHQQYFLVVVELSANIGRSGREDWVLLATKESDPMVVRGRSPGHYKDTGRRDSQASMDPDCGTGHGGAGHSGALPPSGFGHGSGSLDWVPGFRGTNGHFHGHNFRINSGSRVSPESVISSSALTEMNTDGEVRYSDSTKSSFTLSPDRSTLTPVSDDSDEIMFSSLDPTHNTRKRSFEDEHDADHLRYTLPAPFSDNVSLLHEFPAMAYSKPLCAS